MSDQNQYPVAILASSQRAGKKYAKAIDIQNYVVVTDNRQIEGLKIRGIIITPGWLIGYFDWESRYLNLFDGTFHMGILINAPTG